MSEVRKRPQLSLRELFQVNWFLGAGLALLAIWPAFFLDFAVLPHVWVTTFLIGTAILRPQLAASIPKPVWQAVPFLLVVLLAVDLRISPEPIPALIRLNILLILFRCLAFRRKREDLQLIVLCLFLLIIAGVLTVSLAFAIQVLLFTAVAMSLLFNITLMENSRDTLSPREIWKDFTWRRFLARIWGRRDGGFVAVAGIAFCSVVGLSTILFFTIPRFDINNPIPFFGMNRAAHTGFSESIRFGDVTNIRNDDRVALRVEVASEQEVPADPYWRLLVLDDYNNGGFELSRALSNNANTQAKAHRVNRGDPLIGGKGSPGVENRWTFYLEGGVARYLPLTGLFDSIQFSDARDLGYMPQVHVLGSSRVNSNVLVYRVENMEFSGVFKDPDFGTYSLEYEWYPEIDFRRSFRYLNYPDTTLALPQWDQDELFLRNLVYEIGKGEALTVVEFAARATVYIQERHTYSMSYAIPPGDGDHVVRWLKSGQPGHCEVFAGALLLICRAAGIPARVVTGFRGGSWNTFENYYMVRNSDAHAWVEVFDGKDSWIRFDPTPGGSSPADIGGAFDGGLAHVPTDSSFAAYIDSLRILWYRRIVSFDQKSQFELWGRVKDTYGRIQVKEWLSSFKAFLENWWKAPWNKTRIAEALGLAGAAGMFVLLVVFCVRKDRSRIFGLAGAAGDPVRRKAGRQLQRLQSLTAAKELDASRAADFHRILFELQRLRYGPADHREDWRNVIKQARRLARACR